MIFLEQTKTCASCGRLIEYRKKWARNWPSVKYCSDECRKNKNRFDYREAILNLLSKREAGKTICPSEVLAPADKTNPILMEHVRRSARLLATDGQIEITQKGRAVDPLDFRGPIRLRRR